MDLLRVRRLACASLALSLTACSGDDTQSAAPIGAGDAGSDGTLPNVDGAVDSSGDDSSTNEDAPVTTSDGGDAAVDAGPCTHSVCAPGVALDPTCDPCVKSLCDLSLGADPYCCTVAWDLSCAKSAYGACNAECPSDPAAADGGIAALGGTSHAIVQIVARDDAACAVSAEGDVWCWGVENVLGDGSEQPVTFPRKLVGLPVATQSIAMAGRSVCALGVDNGVRCWGQYPVATPQTNGPVLAPPTATVLTGASSIAGDRLLGSAQTTFACVAVAGAVECWGENDSTLGPGIANPTTTPASVSLDGIGAPSTMVTSVFAGADDACVLVGDGGTPLCWGANTTGMIGHSGFGGPAPVVASPTCIPAVDNSGPDDCGDPLTGITKIAIGGSSTCFLDITNAIQCMGDDSLGQLGAGLDGGAFASPQAVAGVTAVDVSIGATHACAAPLDPTTPVVCWGTNAADQLGPAFDGGSSAVPVPVTGLVGVTQVTAWSGGTCALKSDGTVWCWGSNQSGHLATGLSAAPSATPVQVPFKSFP